MQTSNQAIGDQKTNKKGHKQPRNQEKLYKIEKFSQKHEQKGYMTPTTPKSHIVLIGSQGDTAKNKNTKQRKLNKTQIYIH